MHIIVIESTVLTNQTNKITTKRGINDQNVLEFKLQLSHENWKNIFMEDDASTSFNKFVNICQKLDRIWILKEFLKHEQTRKT